MPPTLRETACAFCDNITHSPMRHNVPRVTRSLVLDSRMAFSAIIKVEFSLHTNSIFNYFNPEYDY
jgi:hypothetical protein